MRSYLSSKRVIIDDVQQRALSKGFRTFALCPRRRFGVTHFLIDSKTLAALVQASKPPPITRRNRKKAELVDNANDGDEDGAETAVAARAVQQQKDLGQRPLIPHLRCDLFRSCFKLEQDTGVNAEKYVFVGKLRTDGVSVSVMYKPVGTEDAKYKKRRKKRKKRKKKSASVAVQTEEAEKRKKGTQTKT